MNFATTCSILAIFVSVACQANVRLDFSKAHFNAKHFELRLNFLSISLPVAPQQQENCRGNLPANSIVEDLVITTTEPITKLKLAFNSSESMSFADPALSILKSDTMQVHFRLNGYFADSLTNYVLLTPGSWKIQTDIYNLTSLCWELEPSFIPACPTTATTIYETNLIQCFIVATSQTTSDDFSINTSFNGMIPSREIRLKKNDPAVSLVNFDVSSSTRCTDFVQPFNESNQTITLYVLIEFLRGIEINIAWSNETCVTGDT